MGVSYGEIFPLRDDDSLGYILYMGTKTRYIGPVRDLTRGERETMRYLLLMKGYASLISTRNLLFSLAYLNYPENVKFSELFEYKTKKAVEMFLYKYPFMFVSFFKILRYGENMEDWEIFTLPSGYDGLRKRFAYPFFKLLIKYNDTQDEFIERILRGGPPFALVTLGVGALDDRKEEFNVVLQDLIRRFDFIDGLQYSKNYIPEEIVERVVKPSKIAKAKIIDVVKTKKKKKKRG